MSMCDVIYCKPEIIEALFRSSVQFVVSEIIFEGSTSC